MVNRHEKLGLSEGAKKDGPLRVRRRIIHHVAECFVSRITGRRRGFGKKAKIWRGWGAYEGEDGIGARKKGWEGEEIGGEKMYRGLKSGLGSELVYYNGYTLLVFGWRDYSIEPPQKYTTQFLCDYFTIAGT